MYIQYISAHVLSLHSLTTSAVTEMFVYQQCWASYFVKVHITYYLQQNYLVTVTY